MNMADQKNLLWGEARRNEPMARHTSWRAGGSAERAYMPVDLEDMRLFLASLPRHEPVYVVGLGSNLLVRDGGLRGTVIFTHGALKEIRSEGNAIYAEAGVPNPKLARFAAMHELVGAEFMAGIPGTVGGALTMNAGCYGGEAWGIVESVTTLDRTGQLHQRTPANYEIGYRSVKLRDGGEEWFAAARFKLPPGDGVKSRATIKQLLERRIAAQPLNIPNAGVSQPAERPCGAPDRSLRAQGPRAGRRHDLGETRQFHRQYRSCARRRHRDADRDRAQRSAGEVRHRSRTRSTHYWRGESREGRGVKSSVHIPSGWRTV